MAGLLTVIMAAGKGTRMKSALPKVLHRVGGKPMINHVLKAAEVAGSSRNIVIVGFGGETVKEALRGQAEFVEQKEQLGTGHAVMQAVPLLEGFDGTVMVINGDAALLTGNLLTRFCREHERSGAKATILTAKMPDATGYGRVVRRTDGSVDKVVEHKDASSEERAIREINAGIYCFDCKSLLMSLRAVTCDNAQGEYYLPDVVKILNERGQKVCAVTAEDYEETLGINSKLELAAAEKILRRRKNNELMDGGVTIMDPSSTFVDMDVIIGKDTVIYPFTWLEGDTRVGEGCEIGPNTRFTDAKIGDRVTAHFSYGHECEIEDGVVLGPYVHLRPAAKIKKGVKIGNFVEVKNSVVGEGTKLPHLSYIGDADVGAGVNIGCGSITVNYDGKNKYRTAIEDNAFVGCNSNLVAPVTVGKNAYIGAGSTITKDVPAEALGIARGRQRNIEGWPDKRK